MCARFRPFRSGWRGVGFALGALGGLAPTAAQTVRYEAEAAARSGTVQVATTVAGYSGAGYTTNFTPTSSAVTWSLTAPAGAGSYVVRLGFRSPFGPKGFDGRITAAGQPDRTFSGTFPQQAAFSVHEAGVFELPAGPCTVRIGGGWNYYELDYLELTRVAAVPAGAFRLEAEDATRTGSVQIGTTLPGYSGTGYATNFTPGNAYVTWSFVAPPGAGLYRLHLGYRSANGYRGIDGAVTAPGLGAVGFSLGVPGTQGFARFDAGLIETASGLVTVRVGDGWNYYEIDYLEFTPEAAPRPPLPVPAIPVDPLATPATQALLRRLALHYGRETFAGQHELSNLAPITSATGLLPAILSGDLINYSPTRRAYGANPGSYVEDLLARRSQGHLYSLMWHWNAPAGIINAPGQEWWRAFYTNSTTFDFAAALADPAGSDYAALISDIDVIAVELKKFAAAGVPVLWRPLHEVEGGWFWWGARGPEPFKQLWRLLYERLTHHHQLHNLLWVLTSEDPAWYPGDDVVDLIGVDAYPEDRGDALVPRWESLLRRFDGKKLLALTEFGGVPDIPRMHRHGVRWAYFVPWTGDLGPASASTATLQSVYPATEVITLNELGPLDTDGDGHPDPADPRPTVADVAPGGFSLRFHGSGAPGGDRVVLPLDDPARALDVGAGDFTIDLWLKAEPGANAQPAITAGSGVRWIEGNIILDRDTYGAPEHGDYGLALAGGRVAFGCEGAAGIATTIVGATAVDDGRWRHVAVTRRASDGALRLYVDGRLDAAGFGPTGDLSYRDGRASVWPQDHSLVLGAEKHELPDWADHAFAGWLDELRLSTSVRYEAAFPRPAAPHVPDSATAALYRFDEGGGHGIIDSSGAPGGPSHGTRLVDGLALGPTYAADTPYPADYAAWALARIADPARRDAAADADFDGVANLPEWALASDPEWADGSVLPRLAATAGELVFTYSVLGDAPGFNARVETTGNLADAASWTTAGLTSTAVSDDGAVRVWRTTLPAGSTPRYLRLRITTP